MTYYTSVFHASKIYKFLKSYRNKQNNKFDNIAVFQGIEVIFFVIFQTTYCDPTTYFIFNLVRIFDCSDII